MDTSTTDEMQITSGGAKYAPQAATTLVPIFTPDPVIRYMLCSLSDSAREEYMPQYFSTLMKAAVMNEGLFQEIGEWKGVAVWMPPGRRIDGFGTILRAGFLGCLWELGVGGCKRMLIDYQSQSDACKKRGLPRDVTRYWYLFFIGTVAEARGQGLASKIILQQQKVAAKEDLPMWLEATTAASREVYKKCGFEVVGEFVLGKGTHAASGEEERGGPGVLVWAMFWRPEKGRNK